MHETSGFYKLEGNSLLYGPNYVINSSFTLIRTARNQYKYPVDGWYWFDTQLEAYAHFGIEPPAEEQAPLP